MDAATRATFEELVSEHRRAVFRVCRSILRDEHLGADATQETFLRLWRRMQADRWPERFGGWLRQVAVSTSLDLLRRTASTHEDPAHQMAEHEAATTDDPSDHAARSELVERFEQALECLSEGQRTVFLLRHGAGLRLSEIAPLLGVALPTVKTQFARACLKLQARLAPFHGDEGHDRRPTDR